MVEPVFQVDLHKRDHNLLLQFKKFLGGIGKVYVYSNYNKVRYSINTKDNLKTLILYLDAYPLLSQKLADLTLFKSAVNLILLKSHLHPHGFNKILSLKASLNLGLSDNLNSVFPQLKKDRQLTAQIFLTLIEYLDLLPVKVPLMLT